MRKIHHRSTRVAAADTSAHPLLIFLFMSLVTVLGIVEADLHRDSLSGFHMVVRGESVDGRFLGP